MISVGRSRVRLVGDLPSSWLGWMLWLVPISLFVSRLVQFGGTPGRWVAMWQALLPWQFAATVVALTLAAAIRQWRLFLVMLLGWLSLAPLIVAWQTHGDTTEADGRTSFTVLSANMLYNNEDLGAAIDDVAAINADIVVLSEMTTGGHARLAQKGLLDIYPYTSFDPYAIGLVVMSRFPIDVEGTFAWSSGESQALGIDVDGTQVRLIASHPPPPVFNNDIWNAELELIGNDVAALDLPTVVAGDLNAGWVLPPFRDMIQTGRLTDAMAASGHPWTMTWPAEPLPRFPIVTLDHILVTDQIGVVDADAFDIAGSDHRGLVAEVVLTEPSPDLGG